MHFLLEWYNTIVLFVSQREKEPEKKKVTWEIFLVHKPQLLLKLRLVTLCYYASNFALNAAFTFDDRHLPRPKRWKRQQSQRKRKNLRLKKRRPLQKMGSPKLKRYKFLTYLICFLFAMQLFSKTILISPAGCCSRWRGGQHWRGG